jgi:hypothetical protein
MTKKKRLVDFRVNKQTLDDVCNDCIEQLTDIDFACEDCPIKQLKDLQLQLPTKRRCK